MPKTLLQQDLREKPQAQKDNGVHDHKVYNEKQERFERFARAIEKANSPAPEQPISTHATITGIDDLHYYIKLYLRHGDSVKDEIASLLDTMEQNETNADVQAKACHVLSDLTSRSINEKSSRALACKTIIEEGGIAKIIKAMKLHVNHDGIQQTCCDSLAELGFDSDACDQIVAEDGIPCLMSVMRQHGESNHFQSKSMRALDVLIETNYKITEPMVRDGVIDLAIAAMKKHTDCPDVQLWGIAMLELFAKIYFRVLKLYAVSYGGIDCVLNAMRQHESDEDIQELCCCVLNVLSNDDSTCVFIVAAGGAECAISAIERHPDSQLVQERGRGFLKLAGKTGEPQFSMAAAAA